MKDEDTVLVHHTYATMMILLKRVEDKEVEGGKRKRKYEYVCILIKSLPTIIK